MSATLWYASRATGIVSIVLLTAVLVLGVLIAGIRRPHGDASTVVMGLHRVLSLGVSVFLLTHIATAAADTYVHVGWLSAVVPFASGYAPFLVGLGSLAFDALLAVVVTSALRHRIRERSWRRIHGLSYALWVLAIVHGFGLGTTAEPLLRGVTAVCGVAGLAAILWGRARVDPHRQRRREIAAGEWS